MRKIKLRTMGLMAIMLWSSQASAVVVTHDQAAFLASYDIQVTTTFDDIPRGISTNPTVTFDGVKYYAPEGIGGNYWSWRSYLSSHATTRNSFSFGTNNYVNSFGFDLNFGSYQSPNVEGIDIMVLETDGNAMSFLYSPETLESYLGFHSDIGISAVILNPTGQGADGIYNNVSRSQIYDQYGNPVSITATSVPEPSGLLLFAAGLLGALRIRKSSTKSI